jgi:hypothetical protein
VFWLAGRSAVATTWRDAGVLGPLNGEQLLAIALFAAIAVTVTAAVRLRP